MKKLGKNVTKQKYLKNETTFDIFNQILLKYISFDMRRLISIFKYND